jgi:hypothetical protein
MGLPLAALCRRPYTEAVTERAIQLIWDFRGHAAQGTAEHHARHLAEFAQREQLSMQKTGAEALTPLHWIAWMIVEEKDVPSLRAALNPSRGLEA